MTDNMNMQAQIDAVNQKLDLLLADMHERQLRSSSANDLLSDLALIGKDMYDSTVSTLENHSVELDLDMLRLFMIKLLKNIPTLVKVVDTMESLADLARDVGPMINEMLIDVTKKLHEAEKKGYFSFVQESSRLIDQVVTQVSTDDLRQLSANLPAILRIIKSLGQPGVLNGIHHTLQVIERTASTEVPQYSLLGLIREMRSTEFRKSMAYVVQLMKNMSASYSASQ